MGLPSLMLDVRCMTHVSVVFCRERGGIEQKENGEVGKLLEGLTVRNARNTTSHQREKKERERERDHNEKLHYGKETFTDQNIQYRQTVSQSLQHLPVPGITAVPI